VVLHETGGLVVHETGPYSRKVSFRASRSCFGHLRPSAMNHGLPPLPVRANLNRPIVDNKVRDQPFTSEYLVNNWPTNMGAFTIGLFESF